MEWCGGVDENCNMQFDEGMACLGTIDCQEDGDQLKVTVHGPVSQGLDDQIFQITFVRLLATGGYPIGGSPEYKGDDTDLEFTIQPTDFYLQAVDDRVIVDDAFFDLRRWKGTGRCWIEDLPGRGLMVNYRPEK